MPSEKHLAGAALLGAASGMRTFTPAAALALRGRFGGGAVRNAIVASAAGEYLGDKSPIIPSRVSPPLLFGRLSSGAFCGNAVAGPAGAGLGAAGAVAGAFGSYHARV